MTGLSGSSSVMSTKKSLLESSVNEEISKSLATLVLDADEDVVVGERLGRDVVAPTEVDGVGSSDAKGTGLFTPVLARVLPPLRFLSLSIVASSATEPSGFFPCCAIMCRRRLATVESSF